MLRGAGTVLTDGFHSYTYDADGNQTGADSNTYFYDAQNRRVRSQLTSGTNEFVLDAAGRITSVWPSAGIGDEGHIYGDGPGAVAFRAANGATYFAHTDWMGTDRMHSNPSGSAVAWFTSLPFGDGGSVSDTDQYGAWDFSHYASLDDNPESATYHAQFRQYLPAAGRWMSPDPYSSSYDFTNPQSLNRYAYVLGNPLGAIDPLGLADECPPGYVCIIPDPEPPPYDGGEGGGGSSSGDPDGHGPQECPSSPTQGKCLNQQPKVTGTKPGGATKPKSAARQKCEDDAEQKLEQAFQANDVNFQPKTVLKTAFYGSLHGVVLGCIAGGTALSELGPAGAYFGCVDAGVNGAAIGAVSEPTTKMATSVFYELKAQKDYQDQINNVCSQL